MALWERIVNSYRAARIAWNDNGTDNVPAIDSQWDEYASRLHRYAKYDDLLSNVQYKRLRRHLKYFKSDTTLYKFIRGVFNPVMREVDICAAKCYGGSIDYENFRTGAIPLILSNDDLKAAIRQLYVSSNMGVEKSVVVRSASLYGDVVSQIVDEPQKRSVSIEFPHPSWLKEAEFDGSGNVVACTFEYDIADPDDPTKTVTFKKIMTPDTFTTFKNDKPFAFFEDAGGELVAQWDNPYGFVPVAVGGWKRLPGIRYSVNAFYHSIDKIDELNDGLSVLNDYLRRAMNPPWLFAGVQDPKSNPKNKANGNNGDPVASVDARDKERALYTDNADAKAQSLVHQVDIANAIVEYNFVKSEIYDDLPELSMGSLRDSGNLTDPGITAGYSDAVDRLIDGNGNVDDFMVRTTQMGISVGAIGRYDGYKTFDANSYAKGDLAFYIKPREIIKDNLTAIQRLQAFQKEGFTEKVLELLDVSEQDIQDFLAKKQAQADTFSARLDQPPADGMAL